MKDCLIEYDLVDVSPFETTLPMQYIYILKDAMSVP